MGMMQTPMAGSGIPISACSLYSVHVRVRDTNVLHCRFYMCVTQVILEDSRSEWPILKSCVTVFFHGENLEVVLCKR